VKEKLQAVKSKIATFSRRRTSVLTFIAMPRAATSGQFNAIFAKRLPGDSQPVKAPAQPRARGVFRDVGCSGRTHALEKFSASAIAFRIAMDLLIVS